VHIIHWNVCHITRGTQPKRRMSHLESHCYNKSDPGPKALASPNLNERKSFLVSFEALLDLPKQCHIPSNPSQVYSFVRIHHRVILHCFLCSHPFRKSRDEISFKGEGCNTSCYGFANHLLITFISSLAMHQFHG
jgi:hypothetical protein